MTSVAIADIKLGNLFNVFRACQHVGLKPEVTSDKEKILNADALILPGVGAFGDAMENIKALGLKDSLREFSKSGKPVLGMCLGMQLLFSESEEFGKHRGLEIIEGSVKKFPSSTEKCNSIRIPQVGWNKIFPKMDWSNTILKDTRPGEYMYFIHSYYCVPENSDLILTQTEYEGLEYCSAVKHNNVVAFQFHPERSGIAGLKIYSQWAREIIDGRKSI